MSSRTWAAVGACAMAMIVPAGAGASSVVFTDYESIYTVGADGTGLRTISQRNADHLAVSPNGKQLAYTHGSLYTMKLTGRKRKTADLLKRYPIVRNLGGAYSPSWSPDGKQIVFVGANDGRLYVVKSNGRGL